VLAALALAGVMGSYPAAPNGAPGLQARGTTAGSEDPALQERSETIAAIQVHGNHVTTDAEITAIGGVTVGAPFGPATIADVTARLRASKRFDDVTVLKRFASIADPLQIVLVIVVNEGSVRIEIPRDSSEPVRVVRRRGFRNLMFMPILDAEDGYGVTFGARVAWVGALGRRSRLSFPLTWGGLKRAGAEVEHTFARGPLTRVEVGTAIQRQRNPAFDEDDDRTRAWVKAERALGPVRLGTQAAWQRVSFAEIREDVRSAGVEAVLDTRLDPVLPRNAVYAAAGWERLFFSTGGETNRTRLDGRVYVGVFRQWVFVARAIRHEASDPLPPYLRYLLGGWSNLRGFKAGSFTGDTLVAGSIELRIPLNATISIAKLGVSIFADAGKAYDKGQRFRDIPLQRGYGGSVFITVAAFRLSLAVAHGVGSGTRVNFGGGLTF
jgi:outer membrane protein assembly factor BamA